MKIYVDMDGVLADFFDAAARLNADRLVGWRDMELRDQTRVINEIKNTPNFFLNLEPFPMANTLIKSIVEMYGGYSILSSPLDGYDDCAQEKEDWIREKIHIQPDSILITSDKPRWAEGNVLIDDYGYNIRNWEKAGGFGIKYQADEDPITTALIPLMTMKKTPK